MENGEIVYGDVLIGCDGSGWRDWVTRTALLKAFGQDDVCERTGMQIYAYVSALPLRVCLAYN